MVLEVCDVLEAAKQEHLDLESSWVIGDQPRDAEAGLAAGCRTILLGNHDESVDQRVHQVGSFTEAVQRILDQERS